MRNYTSDNPVFSKEIRIVEEDDLVSADNDTAAAKQLIENDLVLNDRMEKCLGKDPNHGDSKDLTVTFDSNDNKNANAWTDVAVIKSSETHKSLFGKISTMIKNVRYLYKIIGTTDIYKHNSRCNSVHDWRRICYSMWFRYLCCSCLCHNQCRPRSSNISFLCSKRFWRNCSDTICNSWFSIIVKMVLA